MTSAAGRAIVRRFAGVALVLAALTGCGGKRGAEDDASQVADAVTPQIAAAAEPVVVIEGEELLYAPQISNEDQITGPLEFSLIGGLLPDGCAFDPGSGEVRWTPGETDGPGSYELKFACRPEDFPDAASELSLTIRVDEANVPPTIEGPQEVTLAAGETLEVPLRLGDQDFPANQLTLELASGPKGVVVDNLARLVYWEVPEDWQQEQVRLKLTVADNGVPPATVTHDLVVKITGITPPQPQTPATRFRLTEAAVDLPELPRPLLGKPSAGQEPLEIKPVPLELALDPPVDPEDLRLSLLVHHDLKGLVKTQYLDDADTKLAIRLTEPFEAEDVPGNLRDNIAATCVYEGGRFLWTWALTSDPKARGCQNSVRSAVLTLGSRSGAAPRLVALHTVTEVPAPTLAELLGGSDLVFRLMRRAKVLKPIPLEGVSCTADNGTWKASLGSTIDGYALLLRDPRLIQHVNRPARVRSGIQFADFGFRVVPHLDEITIELHADPSPSKTYEELRGARKALINKQQQYRKEDNKLRIAQGQLAAAASMPTKSATQRKAKQVKANKAKADIARSTVRLSELSVQIPADQKAVSDWEKKWDGIQKQLQPVKDCLFYGELWRSVGDVRVPVLRVVPPGER